MLEMAQQLTLQTPSADVFAWLLKPRHWLEIAPPNWHLELVESPDLLIPSSRCTWKARKFGIAQTLVNEITALVANQTLEWQQHRGPFASWRQRFDFEDVDARCLVSETITCAPPSGLLGRLLTADTLRSEIEAMWQFRERRLHELFG